MKVIFHRERRTYIFVNRPGTDEYDLFHKLWQLDIPTRLIHGGRDIVPVECADHIANALTRANLAVLGDCGHFSCLECPDEVRKVISDFFHNT